MPKKYLTPYNNNFVLWGQKFNAPAMKLHTRKDFEAYLFFTRRLLGYTAAPRVCLLRLFLAEALEMIRKRGLYRMKVKKVAKELVTEIDKLEIKHRRSIDSDFMDIMTNSMAGKGIAKVNELRGAIGGAMMKAGVKEYIFYSYPYTVMELAYNCTEVYDAAIEEMFTKSGIYFYTAFEMLRGEKVYRMSIQLLSMVEEAIGEHIPKFDITVSGAREKLDALEHLMVRIDNIRDAFNEAKAELGNTPDLQAMDVWNEEEKKDITKKLSQKFNVKRI